MTYVLLLVCNLALQDTPTPGSEPVPPPEQAAPSSGVAGSIAYATGLQPDGNGRSQSDSAALGLSVKARQQSPQHGSVTAIARLEPGSITWGFAAVTEEPLVSVTGGRDRSPTGTDRALRAELYLFAPASAEESEGTRAEGDGEHGRFYHGTLEHGRIVSEKGDRRLLEEFASAGAKRWLAPFREDALSGLPLPSGMEMPKVADETTLRVVEPLLAGAVRQLQAGGKGTPRVSLADLTAIKRNASPESGTSGGGRAEGR